MIYIKTNNPIAWDSPDHLMPWGTANDNFTDLNFVEEMQIYFKETYNLDKIKFLDLGCSGGQLVIDFLNKGNFSIGLEGSDYSAKRNRANWEHYYKKNLFTCDIAKPYSVLLDNEEVKFNLITAWDVVEHINTSELEQFFLNINNNLEINGLFLASVAFSEDVVNGYRLHQSVFPPIVWREKILPECLKQTQLKIYEFQEKCCNCQPLGDCLYKFKHTVRRGPGTFHLMLTKENGGEN